MNTIKLFHGSDKIIEQPIFGQGKRNNDFGLGFYCTESEELAKEWACVSLTNGIANDYTLDLEGLNILRLNSPDYTILNWIAVLVQHRIFKINTPLANRAKRYLMENFYVPVEAYDVIIGYRADDSYFDFANAFLNNAITVQQLATAMQLGKLGEQIVLKSPYAFSKLQFNGYQVAEAGIYHNLRVNRSQLAEQHYLDILDSAADGLYMADIMRAKVGNNDQSIPRNIFK